MVEYPQDDSISISDESDEHKDIESIKQIILNYIKKIGDLSCVELTPSMWEKKPMKVAGGIIVTEVYKPDLRIGYCRAMDYLSSMCCPYASKSFKDLFDRIIKEDNGKPWEEKVNIRDNLFREMNKMFEEVAFFNTDFNITEGED